MSETTDRYLDFCLEHNRPYFGPVMGASQGLPIRHAYMKALVAMICRQRDETPITILEIGSWAGSSAITWAEALKADHENRHRVVCVDPWRPYFDAATASALSDATVYDEMTEALSTGAIYDLFLFNIRAAGQDDLIIPCKGSSRDVLPMFGAGIFDVVFIDGSHAYDEVLHDLAEAARLIPMGGILCGDDLELQLTDVRTAWAEVHRQQDYIADPASGTWYHPGVTMAVGEYLGAVSVWEGFWAIRKTVEGWAPVELSEDDRQHLCIPDHLIHLTRPSPVLVEEDSKGYNIILFDGEYYGLSYTLGPVDLTCEAEIVRALEPEGTCLVGRTLAEVKQKIEQYLNSHNDRQHDPESNRTRCDYSESAG